jgi:TonB-linked SusC/RagA family outer membrane protein
MRSHIGQLSTLVVVVALVFFVPQITEAQQTGIISGSVTSSDGTGLEGGQVSIAGVQLGGLTNRTGRYIIQSVPAGTHTISAQLIGYGIVSQEVTVRAGQTVPVNFVLDFSAVELEGVVVTALGISRSERGLGYAVDNVQGADIQAVPTDNIALTLAGKSAGLMVKSLGPIGGSSSVVLRGFNSISGSNQVLFIVDGVPVDNSSNAECNTGCIGAFSAGYLGRGGVDYGNGIQDMNPADIQDVTILKGANAAALYGSRAANGVVLITTKNGSTADGFQVEGSTGMSFSTPLKMPTVQNLYGGGQTQDGYNWVNGAGAGYNDATDESWGPALDGTSYSQWWDPDPQPFFASPYSPRKMFQTGHNSTTNLAVSAAGDGRHVRFSATVMDAAGLIPNAGIKRQTFNLSGGLDLGEALNITGAGSYMKTEGRNRPRFRGYPESMSIIMAYWQRQTDYDRLRTTYETWKETGEAPRPGHPEDRVPNWNHNYFDSPYYTLSERTTNDTRDRFIGHVKGEYQFNEWLSAMGRAGTDWSAHRRFEQYPAHSLNHPDGEFTNNKIYQQETNAEFLITADLRPSGDNDLGITARAGGNIRRNSIDDNFVDVRRLNVPGIFNVGNSAGPPIVTQYLGKEHVNSVYGLTTLSYQNLAFVDVTGRKDWSSTLPAGNNSYFYPSVSSSLVLSEMFELPEFLSYAKFRGSWAKVGSAAGPFQLLSVMGQGPFWGSTPSFTHPNQLANSELRPEQTVSIEVGTEFRFANDRGSLDLTYYKTNTSDQILPVDISHTTGYAQRLLNAGEVQNKGFEVMLGLDLFSNVNGLTWTTQANWATNASKVISLTEGLETIVLGGGRGVTVEARVGEPYGTMMGQVSKRDDQGRVMVGFDGRVIPTATKQVVGNFQPDWTAGIRNTFSYHGLNLSVLLDVRHGGDIFCQTCAIQRRTGQLIETLAGRQTATLVHDGVKPDGTVNDVALSLPTYWRNLYSDAYERIMYDASFIKLREVSLNFAFPQSLIERLPVTSGRIAIVGRDLLLFTDVPHIDPEIQSTSGNAQGMELFLNPSPRSIGFTVSFR